MRSAIAALLSCWLMGSMPAMAQTLWHAATEYPATTMPGQGLSHFAADLAERTHGALTVAPRFDAPDGLKSAAIPAAVRDGRIEIGDAFAGALAPLDPLFQLSSLPFLATSIAQARRLYDIAAPAYAEAFARLGQRVLYVTPWPATGLWSRNPVASADDLRGMGIRTYDDLGTDVLRRAGAAPRMLSFADALPQIVAGQLDGVLSSGDGGAGAKLWRYLPNFTAIGYAMPLSFATVSEAALRALDPALVRDVMAAGAATEAAQWATIGTRQAANDAAMAQNGVTMTDPTQALAAVLAASAHAAILGWVARTGPAAEQILGRFEKAP